VSLFDGGVSERDELDIEGGVRTYQGFANADWERAQRAHKSGDELSAQEWQQRGDENFQTAERLRQGRRSW
jgi:hypothetical protein